MSGNNVVFWQSIYLVTQNTKHWRAGTETRKRLTMFTELVRLHTSWKHHTLRPCLPLYSGQIWRCGGSASPPVCLNVANTWYLLDGLSANNEITVQLTSLIKPSFNQLLHTLIQELSACILRWFVIQRGLKIPTCRLPCGFLYSSRSCFCCVLAMSSSSAPVAHSAVPNPNMWAYL